MRYTLTETFRLGGETTVRTRRHGCFTDIREAVGKMAEILNEIWSWGLGDEFGAIPEGCCVNTCKSNALFVPDMESNPPVVGIETDGDCSVSVWYGDGRETRPRAGTAMRRFALKAEA